MRVLVVSNMEPTPATPQRGSFVRDQVAGLRELGLDVETFDWLPGARRYVPATRHLRTLLNSSHFDVVHAHYGLAGACAAAAGARPLVVTFHGTDVRHPLSGRISRALVRRADVVAVASRALFAPEAGRRGLPKPPGRAAVLPCGIDLERFRPIPAAEARAELGLEPEGRYLLFPASPERAVKRHDRAAELASSVGARLLTLGAVAPAEVPLWVNAASAVLITSDNEGFGMAAAEALACDVPVLSTPVGIVPHLLSGLDGCVSAPFDLHAWGRLAAHHLDHPEQLRGARRRVGSLGSVALAQRVATVYRELIGIA